MPGSTDSKYVQTAKQNTKALKIINEERSEHPHIFSGNQGREKQEQMRKYAHEEEELKCSNMPSSSKRGTSHILASK